MTSFLRKFTDTNFTINMQ